MTEAEWLASDDPSELTAALQFDGSDRKFRLFAVAVCYLYRPRQPKRKFEVVVQYADGLVGLNRVRKYWGPGPDLWPERPPQWAGLLATSCQQGEPGYPSPAEAVALLRDVFGNPFRTTVLKPAWLTSDVLALARGIYDEKAFDRMTILADALQDAGCDDPDVLGHCCGPGPHVRGCWVVDLVLGKV